MRRGLGKGFELDDDRERIDVDAVHAYLTSAYWALGRTREVVARHVERSARVVGLYGKGTQIGFSRIESDCVTFAWLFDVYVVPEHRGHGFGSELARFAVDEGPHRELRWILHTRDAFTLYERLGFGATTERTMERPARVIGPLDVPPPTRPIEQCACVDRSGIKLMSALTPNPLHCLDCNCEIEPAVLSADDAERVARWHLTHAAIDRLWLESGPYEDWARSELSNLASPTNARGRELARELGVWFWLFSAQGEPGWVPPSTCPACAGAMRSHARQLLCEPCRIVIADDCSGPAL